MRLVVSVILISIIVALSGCGHVSGNYPVAKKRPPQLPDTYDNRAGEALHVIWENPGQMRAFGAGWRDPADDLEGMRQAIAGGYRQAEPYLKMLEPIADDGHVIYSAAVFLTTDATLQIPMGRIELFFSDGTSATDLGAFFAEQKKGQVRFRDSRNKTLKLQSKHAAEPGKPVGLAFIMPAEYMDKDVTRLSYVRDD